MNLRWLACCLLVAFSACDDTADVLAPLVCNDSGCDPSCTVLLKDPPDPVRSHCSPTGPICDYALMGRTWEYTCSAEGHILCVGSGCPSSDLGGAPDGGP